MTPFGEAFSGCERRVATGYYSNKPSLDVSNGSGRLRRAFQESLCFLGLLFQTQVQGGEAVLLNSCFWKNRLLERVGRGRQDVEGRGESGWPGEQGVGEAGRWRAWAPGGLFLSWDWRGYPPPHPPFPGSEEGGCLKTRGGGGLCGPMLKEHASSGPASLSPLEQG